MTEEIKKGDVIKVEYEGKLKDGKVFDSSNKGAVSNPLEFEVGNGSVIKGFDEAVLGMKRGESKEFSISPKDAYGERKEEFKKEIPKSVLPPMPEDQELSTNLVLMLQGPQGEKIPAQISSITNESIVLDLNHPLAGEELFFKIKVVDIQRGESSPLKIE